MSREDHACGALIVAHVDLINVDAKLGRQPFCLAAAVGRKL